MPTVTPLINRDLDVEPVFRRLVKEWRHETRYSSSSHDKILHPAYQQIIGLGPVAVPLLLHELQDDPDIWFWALGSITRENPVPHGANFAEAVQAWLDWGRAEGIIE